VPLDDVAPGRAVDEHHRVTFASATPMADLHDLTGRALALGLEISDIEIRRPTLEDVYLELTR
jgi:hypothetical protein